MDGSESWVAQASGSACPSWEGAVSLWEAVEGELQKHRGWDVSMEADDGSASEDVGSMGATPGLRIQVLLPSAWGPEQESHQNQSC